MKQNRNKKLTLWATGGLANRFRAIDAAITFCKRHSLQLNIIWFTDFEMIAPYETLLMPSTDFTLVEAGYRAQCFNYLTRRKFSNKIIQSAKRFLPYQIVLTDSEVASHKGDFGFFDTALRGKNSFLRTSHPIDQFGQKFTWVKPIATVDALVKPYEHLFAQNSRVIGIHVRRTDHTWAIKESPDRLFHKYLEAEQRRHPAALFFLCTDDAATEQVFKEKYGDKLITTTKRFGRDSIEAIQHALADWLLLCRCHIILHSYWSSFSYTASFVYGAELREISISNEQRLDEQWGLH